jgi:hypothetical protein
MDLFTDKQLPFIVFDHETNSFSLTQEAKCLLNKIEGPIGLIAVAGMYRTGKSYLLNRMLLDRSDGFGVGPTINPCTKVIFTLLTVFVFRVFGYGADPFKDRLLMETPSAY